MEKRSPYVLIGAAMMLFIAAVVGFVIWKLRAGDQTAYAYYVILFSGDVQGLTQDSPVYYRGLRVGRDILDGVEDVHFAQLGSADVVRHRLVGEIVDAYARWDATQEAQQPVRAVSDRDAHGGRAGRRR